MGGKFTFFIKFLIVVTVFGGTGLRIYRTFIPAGAEFKAYAFDSVSGPEFPAEGEQPKLSIQFEDNGDTKGGNYRTWVIMDHWLWGKRVLATGWSTREVFKGEQKFPLQWLSDHSCEVKFMNRQIGGGLEPKVVDIPLDR